MARRVLNFVQTAAVVVIGREIMAGHVNDDMVLAILQAIQRDLNATMQTGKYSPHILWGLVFEAVEGRNPGPILREISHLENPGTASRARKAREFKGPVLGGKGLWYKHYFQAEFLARNIWDEFNLGAPSSIKKIRNALAPITKGSSGGFFVPDDAKVIADIVVNGTFLRRSKAAKLTGEYIVFEKTPTGHHYLTLALHGEDEAVLARVSEARQFDARVGGARLTGFIRDKP